MAVCTSSFLASDSPSHHDLPPRAGSSPSPSPAPPRPLSPGRSSSSFPVSAKGNVIPFDPASLIANGQSVLLAATVPLSTTRPDVARFIGLGMLSTCIAATRSPAEEVCVGIEDVARPLAEGSLDGCGDRKDGAGSERVDLLVLSLVPCSQSEEEEEEEEEEKEEIHFYHETLRQILTRKIPGAKLGLAVLPVNDLIPATRPENEAPTGRSAAIGKGTGAGWVLTAKIAGALASMGYCFDDVKTVARLVGENVRTVRSMSSSSTGTSTDIALTEEASQKGLENLIRDMLVRLLQPNLEGTAGIRVNSNEPVLLLNVHAPTTDLQIQSLSTRTIAQLYDTYHIKPVRVYAGDYHIRDPDRDGDGREKNDFSISILNVVNTNIGGPSMIQLLDEPCGADGWRVGVTKEEWETCDGSITAVVELGMRNWQTSLDRLVDVKSVRLASTRGDDGSFDHTKRLGHEADEGVLCTGARQRQVAGDETADPNWGETSAAEDEEEDSMKREMVDTGKQYQEEAKEQDASETKETEPGADQVETVVEPDEKSGKSGSNDDAMNKDAEQGKKGSEHTLPVSPGSVSPASGEEYEIVDREQTLIDMVFSHAERR
ncbi:hypothetical protein EPUS_08261 [Endocarpon pusillum Z07020]|uniref:DhaK domain-containing protein n=1 Tax=Endocarpon pusillum (strain Z07020 / HMAS-L-300199) TaxID=1263415 RepID=U1GEF8_ENDPU|nr:uncharacterized protein EPUS_08261 [Endocarpon pusillum Z07020]ERF76007.1 hypothetical protein EPUS_08261 [Endocarpon pusillum Z07020]